MKNRIVVLPGVCALALLFSQSALAQESPATSPSFVSLVPDTPAAELFPRGDRTLDITGQYVAQVTDHRRDQLWGGSIGGSRFFHLSNAGIDGDKNPSINGAIEGYAGLMWRF
jgi:hypothetical protein